MIIQVLMSQGFSAYVRNSTAKTDPMHIYRDAYLQGLTNYRFSSKTTKLSPLQRGLNFGMLTDYLL